MITASLRWPVGSQRVRGTLGERIAPNNGPKRQTPQRRHPGPLACRARFCDTAGGIVELGRETYGIPVNVARTVGRLEMPARIVLVHDDPAFVGPALARLRAAGYDVIGFLDSMSAMVALEHPEHIELLITRVRFPSRTPNGAALARMARLTRPRIKVLFTSRREVQRHTEGLGEFPPRALSMEKLLETVGRMLDQREARHGDPAASEPS